MKASGRLRLGKQYLETIGRHPCFGQAPRNYGRIHLPVAPACNLACQFCSRGLNSLANRPGVAAGLLRPEEAPDVVGRALAFCPEITVVGVAGPGDALASHHGLEALKCVHERFPSLIKCLSTNGLLLVDKLDQILEAGVKTLTVTVNAVDPEIAAEITPCVVYKQESCLGRPAGELLITNQLAGIALAALSGIAVKVNTVLIPDVNSDHIGQLAKAVAGAGAERINIIPLIPQHKMNDKKAPSCTELQETRKEAEKYLPVFKHCRQCRADSIGKLGGKDYRFEVYKDLEVPMTFSHG